MRRKRRRAERAGNRTGEPSDGVASLRGTKAPPPPPLLLFPASAAAHRLPDAVGTRAVVAWWGGRAGGDGGSAAVTSGRRAGRDPADAPFDTVGKSAGGRHALGGGDVPPSSGCFVSSVSSSLHHICLLQNFMRILNYQMNIETTSCILWQQRISLGGQRASSFGARESATREEEERGGPDRRRDPPPPLLPPPSLVLSHSLTKLQVPAHFPFSLLPGSFLPCSIDLTKRAFVTELQPLFYKALSTMRYVIDEKSD